MCYQSIVALVLCLPGMSWYTHSHLQVPWNIVLTCPEAGPSLSIVILLSQIYTRDPRLPISPSVMASSSMRLNLGIFWFLPTTHTKINAKQMRSRLRAPYGDLRLFVFKLRSRYMHVTYAPDESWLCWLREKPQRPPNSAPCRDQDGAGSEISGVNLCLFYTHLSPHTILTVAVVLCCPDTSYSHSHTTGPGNIALT